MCSATSNAAEHIHFHVSADNRCLSKASIGVTADDRSVHVSHMLLCLTISSAEQQYSFVPELADILREIYILRSKLNTRDVYTHAWQLETARSQTK